MAMEIFTPVIALGGIGLLFGIVLAFASKKFAVETDERVGQVRECLPGANCGACGFPGCDGLASAIVAGEAKCNACPVGGASVAENIAAIMGVEAGSSDRKIARVLCQGTAGNTQEKYDYDGFKDCAGVSLYADGNKSCRFACVGFGNCQKSCQFGAIEIREGLALIDPEKCTSCGACAKACPRGVIKMMPESTPVLVRCRNYDKGKAVRDVCAQGCISCQRCLKQCKFDAISFVNNLPLIDYEKCTGCKGCVSVCPTRTIVDLLNSSPKIHSDQPSDAAMAEIAQQ